MSATLIPQGGFSQILIKQTYSTAFSKMCGQTRLRYYYLWPDLKWMLSTSSAMLLFWQFIFKLRYGIICTGCLKCSYSVFMCDGQYTVRVAWYGTVRSQVSRRQRSLLVACNIYYAHWNYSKSSVSNAVIVVLACWTFSMLPLLTTWRKAQSLQVARKIGSDDCALVCLRKRERRDTIEGRNVFGDRMITR